MTIAVVWPGNYACMLGLNYSTNFGMDRTCQRDRGSAGMKICIGLPPGPLSFPWALPQQGKSWLVGGTLWEPVFSDDLVSMGVQRCRKMTCASQAGYNPCCGISCSVSL